MKVICFINHAFIFRFDLIITGNNVSWINSCLSLKDPQDNPIGLRQKSRDQQHVTSCHLPLTDEGPRPPVT